jgi:hypothetical protein
MDELEYWKDLSGVEFGCRATPYFPVHQLPRSVCEFGVENDCRFNDRSVITIEEVSLGYKSVDPAGELEGDTRSVWIRLGGGK